MMNTKDLYYHIQNSYDSRASFEWKRGRQASFPVVYRAVIYKCSATEYDIEWEKSCHAAYHADGRTREPAQNSRIQSGKEI